MTRMSFLVISVLMSSLGAIVAAVSPQQRQDADAVQAFVQQVEREWPGESAQQAITAESLRLFAEAVRIVGKENAPIAELDKLTRLTESYAANKPDAPDQPRRLREALLAATNVADRLIAVHGAAGEHNARRLAAMRRAAESLDLKQPLRRQPDVIERVFHQAAEILQGVKPRP